MFFFILKVCSSTTRCMVLIQVTLKKLPKYFFNIQN